MSNSVYIGTSLDGFIADRNEQLDWLFSVPIPEGDDLGFADFIAGIDALVMGRNSFETVLGMGLGWPYTRPVFVLSTTRKAVPDELADRVFLLSGTPEEVVGELKQRGFSRLYVDGGLVVQSFLEADLIDELIISRIPILLGGGTPLFGVLPGHLSFEHVSTEVLVGEIVKTHYRRKRE